MSPVWQKQNMGDWGTFKSHLFTWIILMAVCIQSFNPKRIVHKVNVNF